MLPQVAGFNACDADKFLIGGYINTTTTETEVQVVDVSNGLFIPNKSPNKVEKNQDLRADLFRAFALREKLPQPLWREIYQSIETSVPVEIPRYSRSGQFRAFVQRESYQTIETSSPFDELDLIRADDSIFQNKLQELAKNDTLVFKDELKVKLERLLAIYKDDHEDKCLSTQSLHGLITFLEKSEVSISPSLTSTSNGDLYVQWESEPYTLSVHFLSAFNAKYAFIKPNRKHPEQWSYSSGATTVDELWGELLSLRLPDGLVK